MAAETATDSGVAQEAPAFLRAAAEPVRQQLGSSVLLADFYLKGELAAVRVATV